MSQLRAQVYEEALPLPIGLIDAEPLAPGGDLAAYPYARLVPRGEEEVREFGVVHLENAWLRATIVPALGGRLLSLSVKAAALEALPRGASLKPAVRGRRGAELDAGLQPVWGPGRRATELADLDFRLGEPEEDGDPAAIELFDLGDDAGVSCALRFELPADRAALKIVFVFQRRERTPGRYDGGLVATVGAGRLERAADGWRFVRDDGRLALHFASTAPLDGAALADGELRLSRFGAPQPIAGRQVDRFEVELVPYADLGSRPATSSEAGIGVVDGELRVASATLRPGHRLGLLAADGQTFEAPADLSPDRLLTVALGGPLADPQGVVLRSPGREDLAVWPPPATPNPEPPAYPEVPRLPLSPTEEELDRLAYRADAKAWAALERAHRALGRGAFAEAALHAETALGFNAEDPLAWWLKALCHRRAGDDAEALGTVLANAHYLAPLEPLLRAEAYLQSPATTKEPSPLLAGLAHQPDAFAEVACRLLEAGAVDEAGTWLDEALRHVDRPLLRYLLAFAFLRGTRMEAQAGEHVAAAARLPLGPPYAWRPIEQAAIRTLRERFPEDAALAHYASLLESARPEPA